MTHLTRGNKIPKFIFSLFEFVTEIAQFVTEIVQFVTEFAQIAILKWLPVINFFTTPLPVTEILPVTR